MVDKPLMNAPTRPVLFIGCAGWSIPATMANHFTEGNSHLERYAQRFNSVEINSSFYRSHLPATYRRWAATVPEAFRFAVKMPRSISHQARLHDCELALQTFLDQVGELGTKLGCLLLQLPPSLACTSGSAEIFRSASAAVSRSDGLRATACLMVSPGR